MGASTARNGPDRRRDRHGARRTRSTATSTPGTRTTATPWSPSLTDDGTYEDPTTGGPLNGDALAANVDGLVDGLPRPALRGRERRAHGRDVGRGRVAHARHQHRRDADAARRPAAPSTSPAPTSSPTTPTPTGSARSSATSTRRLMLRQLGLQAHLSRRPTSTRSSSSALGIRVDTGRDDDARRAHRDLDRGRGRGRRRRSQEATEKIVVELLENPGYLGTCFVTVGQAQLDLLGVGERRGGRGRAPAAARTRRRCSSRARAASAKARAGSRASGSPSVSTTTSCRRRAARSTCPSSTGSGCRGERPRPDRRRRAAGRGPAAADGPRHGSSTTSTSPGMLHAAFVRSHSAHARVSVSSTPTRRSRRRLSRSCSPPPTSRAWSASYNRTGHRRSRLPATRALAHDKVRVTGEPIAIVVAETRAHAEDACELVEVASTTSPRSRPSPTPWIRTHRCSSTNSPPT